MIGTRIGRRGLVFSGFAIVAIAIASFLVAQGQATRLCYAGDPALPAPVADRALVAGASEAAGPSPVVVESVQGELLRQRTRVDIADGTLVGITGWAVDFVSKRSASVVLARIDGGAPLRADTCRDRSDVAKFYDIPAYARSGFGLRLKVGPGVHRVAFFALGVDGRALYRNAVDLELNVSRPAAVRTIPAVDGAITRLDDAAIPAIVSAGVPFSHPLATDLRIGGWIADRTRAVPAALRSLDVLLDGRVVDRAAYGADRPEVGAAPGLRNTGFSARILTDDIAPGTHVITLRATLADGRTTMFGTKLTIDLTRAPGG